ncbi:MAG: hypothetical protein H6567_11610 [Lewinellaceae bacterium]|nr:hypothetical protein [Lewinellaceae bacterium]
MRTFLRLMILVLCVTTIIHGQTTLNLEIKYEVKPIKFYSGDKLTFKSKDFPDSWQTHKIDKFLLDDGVILFDDTMYQIEDITAVKVHQKTSSVIGHLLKGFAAGWVLFGTLGSLATGKKFLKEDIYIGAAAGVLGFLFGNVFSHKVYNIGSNHHLRLVDVSIIAPQP